MSLLNISGKMRQCLILFSCLFLSFRLYASAEINSAFVQLSLKDGLVDNTVKCIAKDSAGFYWFGTKNGLSRYDGNSFRNFKSQPGDSSSLPDNFVYCIEPLSDGNLFVGGANGSASILSSNFAFDQHISEQLKNLLVNSPVSDAVEDDEGNLWIATLGDGVFRVDASTKDVASLKLLLQEPLLHTPKVSDLQLVGRQLYLVSESNYLASINLNDMQYRSFQFGNDTHFSSFGSRLAIGSDSTLFLSTENDGVYRVDLPSMEVSALLPAINVIISDILLLNDSILILATDGSGLLLLDLQNNTFKYVKNNADDPKSLNGNAVWCLEMFDKEYLTCGLYSKGVSFFDLGVGDDYLLSNRVPAGNQMSQNSVLDIVSLESGSILFSTDGGGLFTYDGTTLEPYSAERKDLSVVKDLYWYGDVLLAGTYARGLITVKGDEHSSLQALSDSLLGKSVWSLTSDSVGRLWAGTLYNGLYLFDGQTVSHFVNDPSDSTSLPGNMINSLQCDSFGRIWVGTESNGLAYYHEGVFFRPQGCLPYKRTVYATAIQAGKLLVCYKNYGIDIIELNEDYPQLSGEIFSENSIKSVGFLTDQEIVVATDLQLFISNLDGSVKRNLTEAEAMTAEGYNSNSIFFSGSEIYAGAIDGLSKSNIAMLSDSSICSGLPVIQEVSFIRNGNREELMSPFWYWGKGDTILLEYSDFDVQLKLFNPNNIFSETDYEYRVSGLVDSWTNVDDFGIILPFLKGGGFHVEIRAVGSEECRNNMTDLFLNITKPFWQQLWFVAGLVFTLIVLLFGIFAIRDFSHKRLEERLLSKVEERTLFIRRQNRKLEESTSQLKNKNKMLLQQKALLNDSHQELNVRNEALEMKRVELEAANSELVKQRKEIEAQADILAGKNRLLTKSLRYAKRIQDSLFPTEVELQKELPNSFMFFRPKEIVSGDFFWMKEVNGMLVLAEVDCTGHGVPGAFMSMIGNALLGEIVVNRKVLEPSEIFYLLNEELLRIFSLGGFDTEAQDDGMDLSIAVVDKENRTAKIASAMQNVYLFSDDDVKIFNGDIFSIGGLMAKFKSPVYTTHLVDLPADSLLVMSSDGFIDQFGEVEKDKYGVDRFVEMMKMIKDLPSDKAGMSVGIQFANWLGAKNQLDDVLVVGIRI